MGNQKLVAVWGRSGAGKTTTAINLALTLADRGRSVLLLSTDVTVPSLQRYFGVHIKPDQQGLGLLLKRRPIMTVAAESRARNLFLLGVPDDTLALDFYGMTREDAVSVLTDVRQEFDYVIADAEDNVFAPLPMTAVAYADICLVLLSRDIQSLAWLGTHAKTLQDLRPDRQTQFVLCNDRRQLDDHHFAGLCNTAAVLELPAQSMLECENTGKPFLFKPKGRSKYRSAVQKLCDSFEEQTKQRKEKVNPDVPR